MKTLLLLFMLFSNSHRTPNPPNTGTKVFICNSTSAKKYHLSKNCKGLSTCQHQVHQITLEQAKKKNRTLCGWEKPKLN